MLLLFCTRSAFGQDSVFHHSSLRKIPAIHRLIQGNWVNIEDTNEKLTITNWTITFCVHIPDEFTSRIRCKYKIRYFDSNRVSNTKDIIKYGVTFRSWAGYCIVSNAVLQKVHKIYSVSHNYLHLDKNRIYKKINDGTNN
jgi:hypothetical protein